MSLSLKSPVSLSDENSLVGFIALPPVNPASGYALIKDEPDACVLSNVEAPIDQPELLTYGSREIKEVTCGIRNQHPPKEKGGVQYTVKLEDLFAVCDDVDATFREDLPVIATLTIRHPKHGAITRDLIDHIVRRLLSASYKLATEPDADGTTTTHNVNRFGDLMRSALKPTADGPREINLG